MTKQTIISALGSACIAIIMTAYPLLGEQNTQAKAPDNTAVNKRDKNKSEVTADQGKNNLSDRQLMAHIRRDVVKDKSLSSYAHNVKIIAEQGKVTLKGPVRSEDEKRAIEDYARKYVGEGSIANELSIKAENK